MADPRHLLGSAAEGAVARWLGECGWEIHARRHRSAGGGEVDLLALDADGVLVAVEVRARRTARAGPAAASVDARRVARMARTLAGFAAASGVPHRGLRVDLVTVEPLDGASGRWRLRRLPGLS